MKFPKEFLLGLLDLYVRGPKHPDSPVLHTQEEGKSGRWSICHSMVFEHEGKTFQAVYSVGATECQDESPWEFESGDIECMEVQPVNVTVTHWLPVLPEVPAEPVAAAPPPVKHG